MITYRGFSTKTNAKNYTLNDFELVKQDLINYFSIKKGEKLMQPEIGSIIWSLLFEPLTEDIQQAITDDINKIVGYDPRLIATQIQVLQQTNGFLVQLTLAYIPTNQVDTIKLNFNQSASSLTIATQLN